jgi:hypothetical protein
MPATIISLQGELSVTVDVYDNDHYSDDEFIGWFRVSEPTNGPLTLSGRYTVLQSLHKLQGFTHSVSIYFLQASVHHSLCHSIMQ